MIRITVDHKTKFSTAVSKKIINYYIDDLFGVDCQNTRRGG